MFRLKTLRALISGVTKEFIVEQGACVCSFEGQSKSKFWIEAKEGHMDNLLMLPGVKLLEGPTAVAYTNNRPGKSMVL